MEHHFVSIEKIPGLEKSKLLLFGGCASASRDAGVTTQMIGEHLDIQNQFLAVDELKVDGDGKLRMLERVEGGQYQVSTCEGAPAVLAWATGNLPEPPNNPQIGMVNMRGVMPALQKASPTQISSDGVAFSGVKVPDQQRDTKIVKDMPVEDIAKEIIDWINE